jgi:hypothetical protein
VIELVAITDNAAQPEPPLRAVQSGALAVLYAPAEEEAVSPEALWRREALLEALMEDRDLLPVRFGTRVADEAAAARAVADRGDELRAGLDRVRGAVELAVRVRSRAAEEAPAPAESGRDYIAAKAGRSRAAMRIHEPLAALARESVIQHGDELLRAAYLVEREAVEPFAGHVRALQQEHPELALVCTGPWPPYSFAEGA